MSDDVFDRIEREQARTLYKDKRIFPEDYAPQSTEEVVDREKQKEEIIRCIHNTTLGVRSELCVYGPPGGGKTYTVRAVLNDALKRWSKKFQYAWVNCKTIRPMSEYQIVKEISIQLGKRFGKSRGIGYSTKDLEDWVINKHEENPPLLIVFDEVDVLAKVSDRLLYTFFDKGVSQILLSTVFRWEENVDPRIKSRSQSNSIMFATYTKEQMVNILRFIANKGLKKGAMSEEILDRIAEYTTNIFLGDVRKAKHLMSNSVDLAIKEGAKTITEGYLAKSLPKVEPMSLKAILKNFSRQEQVALAGFVCQKINLSDQIHGKGQHATTRNIYHFYVKCAELNDLEPVKNPMMKEYLQRLEASGILTHETKSHPTRGRTNVYFSIPHVEDLGTVLKELGIKLYGTGLVPLEEGLGGSK